MPGIDQTAFLARVTFDPEVIGISDASVAVGVAADHITSISHYSFRPIHRPAGALLSAGGMPVSTDEIVLAPDSGAALGARLGGHIPLTGT